MAALFQAETPSKAALLRPLGTIYVRALLRFLAAKKERMEASSGRPPVEWRPLAAGYTSLGPWKRAERTNAAV